MHFKFAIVFLLSTLFFIPPRVEATTTIISPGQSIQNVLNASTTTSGSVISVQSGTYNEQITVSKPLTLDCLGTCSTMGFIIKADNVTIKGFNVASPRTVNNSYGIRIYNNNCVIENNRVHDTVRDGILTESNSSGCTIKSNIVVRASQSGMEIRGSNHAIENNEISDTIQYPPELKADGYWGNTSNRVADADCFRFFGTDHTFKNNYCHDISYGNQRNEAGVVVGENIDPHIDGFQTWSDSNRPSGNHIIFDGNRIILSGSGGGFTNKSIQLAGGANNLLFKNNLFKTTLGFLAVQTVSNITLDHNTWIGNVLNTGSWGVDAKLCNNCTLTHNIFSYHVNGLGYLSSNSSITANNNCIWKSGGSRSADPGDIRNQDPLFTNESANNFNLQFSSPCMGKGAAPTSASAAKPGDLNLDGLVNIFDYNLLLTGYGTKYTIFDYNNLIAGYGT